ncbi:MAG TPA: FAD-dependent oxidoreductase [Microbacterium sp.]|nr:FAD-dependent oxidoreductase [Microbacterium sp.]
MTIIETTTDTVQDLRLLLQGEVTLPEDAGWDAARQAWALNVDQRPLAVVHAATVHDILTVVRFARARGLRVAPQSTGHNAVPLGHLGDSILLRTDRLRGVEIDPERRTATVEAGAQWQDVTPLAAAHGLTALAGSAADVGVVGYTLGGGVSWLARSHGLAANSVVAAHVVTADGVLRHVDEAHDPDLFWAIRGGGGGFGIVTSLEFRLFPLAEVFAGALFWPEASAQGVLRAWREWTETVPDSVTSVGRILRFPPFPDIPEPLRGRGFVVVEATMQEDAAEGARLLEDLRALAPELDTFATIPAAALAALHMDPPGPVPGLGNGALLEGVDDHAIDTLIAAAQGAGAALLSVELRHLGGALAPGATEGGAVSGFDADYALFAVGMTPTAEHTAAVQRGVDAVLEAMEGVTAPSTYLNFAEREVDDDALFGSARERLEAVKFAYDRHDLIHANHGVAPRERAGA